MGTSTSSSSQWSLLACRARRLIPLGHSLPMQSHRSTGLRTAAAGPRGAALMPDDWTLATVARPWNGVAVAHESAGEHERGHEPFDNSRAGADAMSWLSVKAAKPRAILSPAVTPPVMLRRAVALTIVTFEDRPDLAEAVNSMPTGWPQFMFQDPMAWNLGTASHLFAAFQLIALEGDRVVAKGHSVPFAWSGDPEDLPDQGWDDMLGRAVRAVHGGRPATAVSALEITIDPAMRGRGLSREMVVAMCNNVRRHGFGDLLAPVRPSAKQERPNAPMPAYVARRRDDGLPVDPWLRVHERLGGVVLKVCPASMSIAGSLAQWRAWTGLPFDRTGDVVVPGALNPVHVSVEHDHAVYVEANVWMHHRLREK